jgi:protein gp37
MKFINDRYRERPAPAHMWFGVSVENEPATSRIVHLQNANASVRFLSIEPLIAPVGRLDLRGIHWVIVGGESGPRSRPIDPEWVIDVRNQCVAAGVAFFFKQWGGRSPKTGGRLLEGRLWSQFPKKQGEPARQRELQTVA